MAKQRRKTPTQEAVLRLLQESATALSQDKIEAALSGQMDKATIYRILQRFLSDGILHKIVSDQGKNYYAFEGHKDSTHPHPHNHVHFKCSTCGNLECLAQTIQVEPPSGYTFHSAHFLITGICKNCQLPITNSEH